MPTRSPARKLHGEDRTIETYQEAIRRILDKLAEVQRRGLTCFGSSSHHFVLNQPLDEESIGRFEQKHGIRLPEDYRAFLLQAGNGGAGPYYGLHPLKRWDEAMLAEKADFLARPSPLKPNMPRDVPWEETLNCAAEDLFQGTLDLVHQGCTYAALLVVTGTYRGRIIYVDQEFHGAPYFVHHPDFLSWYERWLDELLWGYDDFWFGIGLPGREEELARVLTPGGDSTRRGEALSTLTRLASLQPETLRTIQSLLRDESAQIRAQACHLLGKHHVVAATADIAALLDDADADTRVAALETLTRFPGADWEGAARRLLGDSTQSVIFRALCRLKDQGKLRRADVEPLFRSPDRHVRRNALWASGEIQGEPVDVPDSLLHDPDPQVRHHAILAWSRVYPDRSAVLIDLLRAETDLSLISCLIGALGSLGDRAAVPVIVTLTQHADAFVRQDAARALGKLGDRRAIPALTALLSDQTMPYRETESGAIFNAETVSETARTALQQLARV